MEPGGIQIDIKVKMAKICHKGILNLRYFFIEVLDNNQYFNQNNTLNQMIFSNENGTRQNYIKGDNTENQDAMDDTGDMSSVNRPSMGFEDERDKIVLNRRLFDDCSSTNSDSTAKTTSDMIEKDID